MRCLFWLASWTLGARYSKGDYEYALPYQEVTLDHAPRCEKITIPMCQNIGYNYTSMELSPFHHKTQRESGYEAHQFYVLIQMNCSEDLRPFLCSLYTPVCMKNYNSFLPPCRFLCERAKKGCEPLMEQHGFPWPEKMDCSLLPDHELCNHFDRRNLKPDAADSDKEGICQNCQCSDQFLNLNPKYPLELNSMARISQWNVGGQPGCAMPCQSPYLTDDQVNFLSSWVLLFSLCAIISTVIVQATFILDTKRFKYPQRPIVYLSLCYLFISIGYIIRFFVGRHRIACDLQAPDRLAKEGGSWYCQIVFVLIYYFGMASSIWWVMLTFAWFLAAGMKWSSEAIASYGSYMHLTAWILPAVQTTIIIFTSSVDGDPFLGVCGVGNTNINNLHIFILAPLVVYLSAGGLFLIVGFISLLRIRRTIKKQDKQTKKLEKLILKIFAFSVLYMIPAGIQIACYFYESEFRQQWEYKLNCNDSCGTEFTEMSYYVILVRSFMELVVGITSFTWILSEKTLRTWQSCLTRKRGEGNTTISTTSTMTTHDNSYLPNNSFTTDRHTEFHYQYYNPGSKPLL